MQHTLTDRTQGEAYIEKDRTEGYRFVRINYTTLPPCYEHSPSTPHNAEVLREAVADIEAHRLRDWYYDRNPFYLIPRELAERIAW